MRENRLKTYDLKNSNSLCRHVNNYLVHSIFIAGESKVLQQFNIHFMLQKPIKLILKPEKYGFLYKLLIVSTMKTSIKEVQFVIILDVIVNLML